MSRTNYPDQVRHQLERLKRAALRVYDVRSADPQQYQEALKELEKAALSYGTWKAA